MTAGTKLRTLNENTASSSSSPVLVNVYSRPATGRLELSASPGSNGLHPVMRAVDRQGRVRELDARERELRTEGGPVEAREPQAERPAAGGRMAALVELPPRHLALDDAGDPRRAADRDGGEEPGLVLEHGPVPYRDVREGAGALEAYHAGAEAPHGEGDLRELIAGVSGVGAPGRGGLGRGGSRCVRGPGQGGSGGERPEGAHRAPHEFAAGDESFRHKVGFPPGHLPRAGIPRAARADPAPAAALGGPRRCRRVAGGSWDG